MDSTVPFKKCTRCFNKVRHNYRCYIYNHIFIYITPRMESYSRLVIVTKIKVGFLFQFRTSMQISCDSRVAGPGQISVALLSFWQSDTEIELIFCLILYAWSPNSSERRTKSNQLRKQNNSLLISCSCMRRNYRSCSSIVLACAGITKRIR